MANNFFCDVSKVYDKNANTTHGKQESHQTTIPKIASKQTTMKSEINPTNRKPWDKHSLFCELKNNDNIIITCFY